jgi:hypothetical protein
MLAERRVTFIRTYLEQLRQENHLTSERPPLVTQVMSDDARRTSENTGSFLKLGLIFAAAASLAGCAAADAVETSESALSEPWVGNVTYAIDRASCGGVCGRVAPPDPEEGPLRYVGAAAREHPRDCLRDLEGRGHGLGQPRTLATARRGGALARDRRKRRLRRDTSPSIDVSATTRATRSISSPSTPFQGSTRRRASTECPAATLTANAGHVDAIVELYFTVNGVEQRPAAREQRTASATRITATSNAPCF